MGKIDKVNSIIAKGLFNLNVTKVYNAISDYHEYCIFENGYYKNIPNYNNNEVLIPSMINALMEKGVSVDIRKVFDKVSVTLTSDNNQAINFLDKSLTIALTTAIINLIESSLGD